MHRTEAVAVHRSREMIRVFLLAALLAAFVAMPLTGAEAVTRPQTLYHERPVQAGPVEPGFPVDFVGVVFDLPAGVDLHDTGAEDRIAVRFRHDGVWGPWQRIEEDGAQAEGTFTGALVSGEDADAYQVRGIPTEARRARAAAINTTDGPREVVGYRPAGSAEAVTSCKSRADWGADEGLRTSNRAYAPIQVLTVHHTATSNLTAASDPDAVVRAIYEYHTTGNGWDDIGYQALIAPDGTVYEGRWSGSDSVSCVTGGGDGSDFGHQTTDTASDIVTGAHSGGYNTGNFGVSLLGHFVDEAPTSAARGALVEYLAELAGRHGLDPQGTVAYDNGVNATTADAISGHRDFTATECPGGVLYDDLPQIRADVATALDGGAESPPPDSTSDAVATGEATAAGSVSGSYLDTHADGGGVEQLREVESGGKPARRTSLLEHTWTIPVTSGSTVTLHVDGAASASADGDGFAFSYSTDGGATYTPAFTIPAGAADVYSASLPATTSGDVRVRVLDTNRTSGNRSLDTLTVDHLYIRTEADDPPPDGGGDGGGEPAAIDLTASGWKDKGSHVVDLAWSGGSGEVVVTRDDQTIYTGSATTYQDRTGAKGGATYTYRVCEAATPTTCSARVTVTF